MKITFRILLLFICFQSFSQDIKYAREVLDTLCSPSFDGRGIYNNGEKRAAEYIRNEFKKNGLKAFNNSYFQKFEHPANAISGKIVFKIDDQELVPGKDFLIDPSSPKFDGKEDLIFFTKEEIMDIDKFKLKLLKSRDKFVVIDKTLIADESREVQGFVYEMIMFLKLSQEIPIKGVVEVIKDKLTYTASQEVAARPHLIVLKDKINKKSDEITLKFNNVYTEKYQSQNVIGYLEGQVKDSLICVVGHYDHLGRMGDSVYFPGANDNASGIAMMLNLAKDFNKEKLKYSVVFIAFGSEEIGLVGSKYFTENPLFPLQNIKFLLNLDILGTGDDGIQVVNGKEFKKEFDKLVSLNKENNLLKQVKIRGSACNSDHCFFYEKGVPSFFIYTLGGIAHYHNVFDKSETLPLTEFEDLFKLLKKFLLEQ
ncbi:M28 family metallopeptidase [Aureivirga sp. CE67]|uniref:M28 family metallopeptidase n=1 Tax=Aureivirga sp. CE67 TaxID=1788983 RepID=UPI0018CA83CE|nr:M20/M25/M40 family metallo-hydrolase [Aureivirga sp. CE67]